MSKNLNHFWQFFMRQISIVVGKWPKIEKQSIHLVTLSHSLFTFHMHIQSLPRFLYLSILDTRYKAPSHTYSHAHTNDIPPR